MNQGMHVLSKELSDRKLFFLAEDRIGEAFLSIICVMVKCECG